jgi:16S rRNA processing protein RimM
VPGGRSAPGLPEGHVVVGQVGKPFGNRGEVYVFADPDLSEPFDVGTAYATAEGDLVVDRSRMHGTRLVVGFEGVDGREPAEALRGRVLTRPREALELDEDAVWVADLLGRQVVDPDGALVGVVERIVDGHAHDYLVLARPDGGEAVIPMVPELLDHLADPMVLQPVQGLVDPDEAW